MPQSVVIIGAGQAGFQVAASLRQEGYENAITLIGDEPGLPYQRPPLSKAYLSGKIDAVGLLFRPAKFFADNRIELVTGEACAIDRIDRRVSLRGGGTVGYDHLVIATGARNRALPVRGGGLDGVFGIKSLRDANAIAEKLALARDVVVIGAGFVGLEFAALAAAQAKSVDVLELADRPMARAVSTKTAAFFAEAHRNWGARFHFGQRVSEIEGGWDGVSAVRLTDGRRLRADLVVFGIGVLPNQQIAADAGLRVENGIHVDPYLLTADRRISAIGDCAMFPSVHAGGSVRLESVQNAADQGRAVAVWLTGKGVPYAAVPWFWTDQGDLKLQMAGLSLGYDMTITLGDSTQRSFTVLLFRHSRLIAVESVNRPGDFMAARKILSAGRASLRLEDAAAKEFDLRAWEAANR